MRRRNSPLPFLALALTALLPATASAAEKTPRAILKVTGLGWQENRLARDTLTALLGDKPRPTLDANAIEDAGLMLFSQETDAGYLKPGVTVKLKLSDGGEVSFPLDARLEHPLPRPIAATEAVFEVKPGRRYVLQELEFAGLASIPEERARAYFLGESLLLTTNSDRIYAPSRLARSAANLQAALQERGFAEAEVTTEVVASDDATGNTHVRVTVREGARWRVGELRLAVDGDGETPTELTTQRIGRPWSPTWRQDTLTAIRRWYYAHGYPDVQVRIDAAAAPPANGRRTVVVTAKIVPGSKVRVGEVRFTGNAHTRESALRRLVPIHTGDPLDPTVFDDGQSRLARLGVFNHIGLEFEPADGETRDAIYHVTEGRRQELSLLGGYGSYEQLRGGIEWRHFNLLGRAHSDNLQLVQSMKSTQGSYTYTVPELFGTEVDGSARVFGLRREELAFERVEYGGNVSLLWPLHGLGANLTTGYTYQSLRNADNELGTQGSDPTQTKAASIDLGLIRDKRDNPLQPHRGYKVALRVEAAAKTLGGEVNYQQILFTSSWHTNWGRGRWIHLGLAQGAVLTLGAPDGSQPPLNVLFYPGGDGSIRGYSKDEAAPRLATGQFVGAKAYTQLNAELEQALTRKWTAVAFVDAVGTAVRLEDFPFSEKLYSAGLGIRYQTVIGPIRLEYGRNLNPREFDPKGTLLFSVGYPF